MDGATTVREIAQVVGIHFTTVALALRDSRKVSVATRARVKEVAKAMGYRANPLVSALMARQRMLQKTNVFVELAYLSFCQFPGEYRRSHHEASVVDGARRRAKMLGYRLEEFCLNAPNMTSRRMAEIFRSRGTAGIFFGGAMTSHSHVAKPLHDFPSVAMSHCMLRPNVHRVAHHHLLGCETAFRELRKLGKKRVGLVLTKSMDRKVNRLWSSGFLGTRHLLPKAEWVEPLYLENLEEEHRGVFMDWVKQEKPDAILTMHVTL
ncbi:MAG: LacI family DNA-binding transcriptional regulator, partial [Gloeobacteraceae cyanobacterium ES-bin-144]|nr:LacI family DNA-binding transcriptional regulator [Verrucomicrobiales bacterium]